MWRLGASRGDGLRSARSTRSGSCTLVARLRTSRSCRGRRRERGYMFVYTSSLAFFAKSSGQPGTPHRFVLVLPCPGRLVRLLTLGCCRPRPSYLRACRRARGPWQSAHRHRNREASSPSDTLLDEVVTPELLHQKQLRRKSRWRWVLDEKLHVY